MIKFNLVASIKIYTQWCLSQFVINQMEMNLKKNFKSRKHMFSQLRVAITSFDLMPNLKRFCHPDTLKDKAPEFIRQMKESFCVDDLVSRDSISERGFVLYKRTKGNLRNGRLRLRRQVTNSKELMESVSRQEEEATVRLRRKGERMTKVMLS